ncbi:hypothetical protein XM38_004490 [Halomicronema hongdechloris C2206]|uniref:Uncharacterized protein n=1 Tax=Halomicronema hongdechloris C2206 TaxID=1641165 RepID=A0A1Z3HGR7_9CYAN|nr:SUMF1/EgtB/PvdO family nonheme iron enzyme [Halomicronema hongdechloris]ASC69522.1 hypothetical protein XM38_004490 [Halomicronema hongdechloris C2206]
MRFNPCRVLLTSVVTAWLVAGASLCPASGQPAPSTPEPSSPTPSPTASPVPTPEERIEQLWQEHQVSLILAAIVVGGYLGVLWIKPLWLLKLPSTDITVPWSDWKLPLGMVRSLKYRDRVLDVWVEQHWQTAKGEFFKLSTVDNRAIHIPLPVTLDKVKISDLTGPHLAPTFQRKTAVLLICGEGGIGKTSLACQIAQWGLDKQLSPHRMIPVLIETELDGEVTLLAAIRGQLNALTNQPDPIAPDLLEKLLQRQRLLVIVDHLSEMGEATRDQIKPQLADFPAKALVVTSRLEESLGGIRKTVVRPMQVEANRLWPFMSAYLEAKGKQDLFEDDQYSDGCDRLRRMARERSITVLLARLYIDHMIQERQGAGGILPDSVPKLMLSYLNQLNFNLAENSRDNLAVQRDAKLIAWECLQQTYRPVWIKKVDAIAALARVEDSASAQDRLEYLEKRLQFLQTPEPGDSTRIILDPLAEYLAAAYWVEQTCQQPNPKAAWQRFFADVDQTLEKTNETPEIIRGFLLAVRDCCIDNANDDRIPKELPDQLARKVDLDPEELRRQQETRRIRRLISELSAPELKYRLSAAEDLGNRGAAARVAEPNLVGMLENPNQTLEARQAAAQALGKLGIAAAPLLTLLKNSSEAAILRRSVAEALGQMKTGQAELLSILEDGGQPLILRQGAARAMSLIGAPSGEPVPMLLVELGAKQVTTQVKPIQVWREPLPGDIDLELVAIPGGDFLMGSPPDEVGRDWYPYVFAQTEGLNVEAQHWVMIRPFWMSRYPITQAQWRAVAALPKINQDLDPNPSNFKGDNYPVEAVSWYETMEFCERLSQYTGKSYRLPSEAEWEYACRAGTTGPFHLGDTLSTELANYDGSNTYGNGIKGEYRQKTTDVGSFGVVNAFGLADMHGNVWEWCLDHWHSSYNGAPTDSSAWVTEGDDRYRLLRGGSWLYVPDCCRSAFRFRDTPINRNIVIGFRVVCVSSWTHAS